MPPPSVLPTIPTSGDEPCRTTKPCSAADFDAGRPRTADDRPARFRVWRGGVPVGVARMSDGAAVHTVSGLA
jgi:hypothetical protein